MSRCVRDRLPTPMPCTGDASRQEAFIRSYMAKYFDSDTRLPTMPEAPLQAALELDRVDGGAGVGVFGGEAGGRGSGSGGSAGGLQCVTQEMVAAALAGGEVEAAAAGREGGGVLPVVLRPLRAPVQVSALLRSQQDHILGMVSNCICCVLVLFTTA